MYEFISTFILFDTSYLFLQTLALNAIYYKIYNNLKTINLEKKKLANLINTNIYHILDTNSNQ